MHIVGNSMGYVETISKLFDLQKFGMKFGLDSMRSILQKLGNPEAGQGFIHISGTNGKGSTAAMISASLWEAGFRAGIYTSPHLVTFRERIQINGEMLSHEDVENLADFVWKATNPESPPTFFEFVTAMAFVYFKRQKTDISVIETGLGGRLDSTNVVTPLLSAITNIGLEHTEHLGNTIAEIAFEKAGVIKENTPFVGGRMLPEALKVMEAKLKEMNAPGKLFGRDYESSVISEGGDGKAVIDYKGPRWSIKSLSIPLSGLYQADNAALALAILEELPALGISIKEVDAVKGFAKTIWPGRGEVFSPGSWPLDKSAKAPLMLDGAHNPDGAKAFGEFLEKRKGSKIHLIAGVMADKDIQGVLGPIISKASRLYLTRPVYQRAASPELLLERIKKAFGEPKVPFELYQELPHAIEAAAKNALPGELAVISGSLFTVGEARAYLTGEKRVESN
jgi:dihydrofolate synthase/folylpolyglutamate synthase